MDPSRVELPYEDPVVPWLVDRAMVVLVLAVGGSLIWMLSSVRPDARGFGTHEQLGMAPCGWPAASGIPCPTCGVTTSAASLLQLRPWDALVAQPFGVALTLLGLWLMGLAVVKLVRNRPYVAAIARMPYGTILVVLVVLLLGSWLYKYLTFPAPSTS